jgi:hypothetical protein
MSDTITDSVSFTAADVIKVADRFGADLVMLTQSSEAMGATWAEDSIHDVKLMAKKDYIHRVSVILEDAAGRIIRARKYDVSKNAALWTSDRPGGNIWPRTPDGSMTVIVNYTDAWSQLGSLAKENFNNTLRQSWGPSEVDTDFPKMSGQQSRRYASNAYGMQRMDYE